MTLQYFNVRRVSSGPVPSRCSSSALTAGSYLRAKHRNKYSKDATLACRHLVATDRSMQLKVVAFRDAKERTAAAAPRPSRSMSVSEYFSIDVDYYRLLQVPRVSRPDAVRKAYEALVKQPPATAYSADTLFSRAVLLKSTTESLVDPDLRRSYDAKLSAGLSALRVSHQDLPGALVVLQEVCNIRNVPCKPVASTTLIDWGSNITNSHHDMPSIFPPRTSLHEALQRRS